jgi:hypothetical protein
MFGGDGSEELIDALEFHAAQAPPNPGVQNPKRDLSLNLLSLGLGLAGRR